MTAITHIGCYVTEKEVSGATSNVFVLLVKAEKKHIGGLYRNVEI